MQFFGISGTPDYIFIPAKGFPFEDFLFLIALPSFLIFMFVLMRNFWPPFTVQRLRPLRDRYYE